MNLPNPLPFELLSDTPFLSNPFLFTPPPADLARILNSPLSRHERLPLPPSPLAGDPPNPPLSLSLNPPNTRVGLCGPFGSPPRAGQPQVLYPPTSTHSRRRRRRERRVGRFPSAESGGLVGRCQAPGTDGAWEGFSKRGRTRPEYGLRFRSFFPFLLPLSPPSLLPPLKLGGTRVLNPSFLIFAGVGWDWKWPKTQTASSSSPRSTPRPAVALAWMRVRVRGREGRRLSSGRGIPTSKLEPSCGVSERSPFQEVVTSPRPRPLRREWVVSSRCWESLSRRRRRGFTRPALDHRQSAGKHPRRRRWTTSYR